jgi:para-nitrobenzyl esterase
MLRRIALAALVAVALGSTVHAAAPEPSRLSEVVVADYRKPAPTVTLDSGQVAGEWRNGVFAYKGVPFAAPPVGALRWKPPQPPAPWSGVRDADTYGPACPQAVDPGGRPNGGGYAGPISEDCLNLNVFTPVHAQKAPVMVWIFGGGNTAGANSIAPNDGTAFARDGVILVSVNYRLGALGFFAHPALTREAGTTAPLGSYGTMDQIAALKWVRRNIKAFGGDPDNVTIFGESAGGWDTLTLMTTPAARGLFAKATVQSGGGWNAAVSLSAAEADGVAVAKTLGLPADATADQLRALPVQALVAAHGRFNPIVDGRLITENATQAFARGHQARVPLIIGSNSWEASLLPPTGYSTYLAAASLQTKAAYAAEAADDAKLAQAMFTDSAMGAPARWIAAKQSVKAPAWLYYFSYVRVARRGKIPGANHTSENPYVFDSQMGIPNYADEIVADDRALAATMHSCWVAFAKTGAPTCTGAPAWPAYAPGSDRLTEFGLTTGVRTHFRKPELDAQEKAAAMTIGESR